MTFLNFMYGDVNVLLSLKTLAIAMFATILAPAGTQVKSHVTWQVTSVRLNDSEALISFTAVIDKDWHIYSQKTNRDIPTPTQFGFTVSSEYELVDGVREESSCMESTDLLFHGHLKRFEKYAVFTQKVKLKPAVTVIKGFIRFMACSNESLGQIETIQYSIGVKVRETQP